MSSGMFGWRRCWNGRVLHYYGTYSLFDTLCGASVRGHGVDPMSAREWPRCPRCERVLAKATEEGGDEDVGGDGG